MTKVLWQFTGQGSQFPGMGQDWYDGYPAYRQAWQQCADLAKPHGLDLCQLAFESDADHIQDTQYAQVLIFALEYALSQLLLSDWQQPDALIGHSIGEYASAVLSGQLTLTQALNTVILRGRLMSQLPQDSGMIAVMIDEEAGRPWQKMFDLDLSCCNHPKQSIYSGLRPALAKAQQALKAAGIRSSLLMVSHGFHSRWMQPMLPAFSQQIHIHSQSSKIPWFSTSNLCWQTAVDALYWRDHIEKPVRYWQAITALCAEDPQTYLVEVGPKSLLTALSKKVLRSDYAPQLLGLCR